MPPRPGNHGQILEISPIRGDAGDTVSVEAAGPNLGQFEFSTQSQVALYPASSGLLSSIRSGGTASGFISVLASRTDVLSSSRLTFEIPLAIDQYAQSAGTRKFFVKVVTPPAIAWSVREFAWDGGAFVVPTPAAPTSALHAPSPVHNTVSAGSTAAMLGQLPEPSAWTRGNLVEPLVDGQRVFSSLHADLQAAGEFIYIAFWRFNPDLVLDPTVGLTLGQLLVQKANQGTTVKILLWDFNNNIANWLGFVAGLGTPVSVGPFPELELGGPLTGQAMLDLLLADKNRTNQWYQGAPQPAIELLWAHHPDRGMPAPSIDGRALIVGSHHQKMVVMDQPHAPPSSSYPFPDGGNASTPRLVAYVLGLNAINKYWDDSRHRLSYPARPSPEPWHDAGVRVEGPEAGRAEQEFVRRWNLWRPNSLWPSNLQNVFARGSRARYLVTCSGRPQIQGALTTQLARAANCVYIEDQYFSNRELFDELIGAYLHSELVEVRAARAQGRRIDPGNFLQIALVTNGPETYINGGITSPMEVYRYVNFLNLELCTCRSITLRNRRRVRRSFGVDWRLQGPDWDMRRLVVPTGGRGTKLSNIRRVSNGIRPCYALSSDQSRPEIYIHSKLTIADDTQILVGSANYSYRSMQYDSEAALEVDDPGVAESLRADIYEEFFGAQPTGSIGQQFARWHQQAQQNRARLAQNPQAPLLGGNVHIVAYPYVAPNFALVLQALVGTFGSMLFTHRLLQRLYPLH